MAKTTPELIADIKTDTKKAPTGPVCPKCGQQHGWFGPRYQKGERVTIQVPHSPTRFRASTIDTVESLIYQCAGCGYLRHEPCTDQK